MSGLSPEQVKSALSLQEAAKKSKVLEVSEVVKLAKDITSLDIPEDVRGRLLETLYKSAGLEAGVKGAKQLATGKSPLEQTKEIIKERGAQEIEAIKAKGDIDKYITQLRIGADIRLGELKQSTYEQELLREIDKLRDRVKNKDVDRALALSLELARGIHGRNEDATPEDLTRTVLLGLKILGQDEIAEKLREGMGKGVSDTGKDDLEALAEEAGVDLSDMNW